MWSRPPSRGREPCREGQRLQVRALRVSFLGGPLQPRRHRTGRNTVGKHAEEGRKRTHTHLDLTDKLPDCRLHARSERADPTPSTPAERPPRERPIDGRPSSCIRSTLLTLRCSRMRMLAPVSTAHAPFPKDEAACRPTQECRVTRGVPTQSRRKRSLALGSARVECLSLERVLQRDPRDAAGETLVAGRGRPLMRPLFTLQPSAVRDRESGRGLSARRQRYLPSWPQDRPALSNQPAARCDAARCRSEGAV